MVFRKNIPATDSVDRVAHMHDIAIEAGVIRSFHNLKLFNHQHGF